MVVQLAGAARCAAGRMHAARGQWALRLMGALRLMKNLVWFCVDRVGVERVC